jgi:hypothetical protein
MRGDGEGLLVFGRLVRDEQIRMRIQAKIVKRKFASINAESTASDRILIEVGAGELIDKLTILHIKHAFGLS